MSPTATKRANRVWVANLGESIESCRLWQPTTTSIELERHHPAIPIPSSVTTQSILSMERHVVQHAMLPSQNSQDKVAMLAGATCRKAFNTAHPPASPVEEIQCRLVAPYYLPVRETAFQTSRALVDPFCALYAERLGFRRSRSRGQQHTHQ